MAVSIESIQAIGQHFKDLSASQVRILQKVYISMMPCRALLTSQAEYVGCMLFIANMGCARISVCLLIKKILPGNIPSTTALVFAGFTVLWTISGVLVTAFPCSLPNPWQFDPGKKCIDLVKWINYVGITNIVVEILLVSIPLCVWNLRCSAGRRVSVSMVFLARLRFVPSTTFAHDMLMRFQYCRGHCRRISLLQRLCLEF